MTVDDQQEILSLPEFNEYLTRWLGESTEDTVAPASEYRQNYLKVSIGGVACGLSGDSTREGVLAYLAVVATDDLHFRVVANQKGTINRVVVGDEGEPIAGFYLYTLAPLESPVWLEADDEWPDGRAPSGQAAPRRTAHDWAAPDLRMAAARDLFALQGQLMAELRERGVLRTNNNPVADYSEWLVWKAFGAERLPANSTASYDLTSQDFGRIQVKARVVSSPLKSGQLQTSFFRSTHFDHAALVLLSDVDYSVVSAVLLPLGAVEERWSWHKHIRGWRLQMNGPTMQHPLAVDITEQLRAAAAELA